MKTYGQYQWRPHRSPRESGYCGRRRRDATVGPLLRGNVPNFDAIVHPDNLLRIYDELRRVGGQSPGPDRVTYDDLSRPEIAAILRGVARQIQAGRYRPSVARYVQVPKSSGGHRTISIRSIADRVVAAAMADASTPYWESVFDPRSHGFRPGQSVWDMLVAMEREMVEQDRWVLAVDDIRTAFDCVVIDQVMEILRRHFDGASLLNLIERVLRGNPRRDVGIDQGSALSPLALNVLLHDRLDIPSRDSTAIPPWHRYADNLVYLCRSVPEGRQTLADVGQILQRTGLRLKGVQQQPVDLRRPGSWVEVLGFSIRLREGRIQYGFGPNAWEDLAENLTQAHRQPIPHQSAIDMVLGWINAYGPAFDDLPSDAGLARILTVAAQTGFRELPGEHLGQAIERSRGRWRSFGEHHMSGGQDQVGSAAAPQAAYPTGRAEAPEATIGQGLYPADRGCPFDPGQRDPG